jgi:hypothetical protein
MTCYKATFTFTYWTAQPVSDYATGWMIRNWIPFSTEVRGLSLIQSDHTDSGEYPPFYIMGTEVPTSRKKRQEGEADQLPSIQFKGSERQELYLCGRTRLHRLYSNTTFSNTTFSNITFSTQENKWKVKQHHS